MTLPHRSVDQQLLPYGGVEAWSRRLSANHASWRRHPCLPLQPRGDRSCLIARARLRVARHLVEAFRHRASPRLSSPPMARTPETQFPSSSRPEPRLPTPAPGALGHSPPSAPQLARRRRASRNSVAASPAPTTRTNARDASFIVFSLKPLGHGLAFPSLFRRTTVCIGNSTAL